VNDAVTQIEEPDQTVVVHVEDDYVALEVFFRHPIEDPNRPDEVILLGASGAERLGSALILAAMRAREAS
jgi:hypothetical protein